MTQTSTTDTKVVGCVVYVVSCLVMTTDVGGDSPTRRTFDEQLGQAIHEVLWRRKITQTVFAEVLNISPSALSQKLSGRRPFFAGELSVIAASLGVPVADLLPAIEVDPPRDPNPGSREGAPTRTRTWDLRIIRRKLVA